MELDNVHLNQVQFFFPENYSYISIRIILLYCVLHKKTVTISFCFYISAKKSRIYILFFLGMRLKKTKNCMQFTIQGE